MAPHDARHDQANWFVALPVAARAWFAALPPPPTGVRLFSADDLHLTVAFLGRVDAQAAAAAFALAPRWPLPASWVTLGPVVAMGRRQRPSAFSALLVEPKPVADAIAAVRDGMCEAAGARPDPRPPLPHVTLARPRRRASESQRASALRWAQGLDLDNPSVRLDLLSLYTWSRDRRTQLFERVATHALPEG